MPDDKVLPAVVHEVHVDGCVEVWDEDGVVDVAVDVVVAPPCLHREEPAEVARGAPAAAVVAAAAATEEGSRRTKRPPEQLSWDHGGVYYVNFFHSTCTFAQFRPVGSCAVT